jgi:DNA polymerase III sliding clamp (beta) subunit (PCNA family)
MKIDMKRYGTYLTSIISHRDEIIVELENGILKFGGMDAASVAYYGAEVPVQEATINVAPFSIKTAELKDSASVFKEIVEVIITQDSFCFKGNTKSVSIKIMEPQFERNVPSLNHANKLVLSSEHLKDLADAINFDKEKIIFQYTKNNCVIVANSLKIEWMVEFEEEGTSKISSKYIKNLLSTFKEGSVLELKHEHPFIISDDVARYLIAPRIDND